MGDSCGRAKSNEGPVEHPPTHSDLAAQVGSHGEEVTRKICYLRRHALIERTGTALMVRVDAVEDPYQRERQ